MHQGPERLVTCCISPSTSQVHIKTTIASADPECPGVRIHYAAEIPMHCRYLKALPATGGQLLVSMLLALISNCNTHAPP